MIYFVKICLVNIFLIITSINSFANESRIIAKVGNEIITNFDLENEIKTNLILEKKNVSQENINLIKDYSIKNLIKKKIKHIEINRFEQDDFSQEQFNNYISKLNDNLTNNKKNLKDFFKDNNIKYEVFIEDTKNELKWNKLIVQLYGNQLNVNPQEIENELLEITKKKKIDKIYELSEIQLIKDKFSDILYQEIKKTIELEGFVNAVQKFSISETKKNDGILGSFKEDQLNTQIASAINNLAEGQYTNPIITDEHILIIKVDKIETNQSNYDADLEKTKLLNKKKQEKLELFSSSHFSNLESSIMVSFL